MLKKCKKPDDVLIINASGEENFKKGKRQNKLLPEHIEKIVDTYQYRKGEKRYSRRVSMKEIENNDYNLNIIQYFSTTKPKPKVDLKEVNDELVKIEKKIVESTKKLNKYLKELGLTTLPFEMQNK